jgi:hypothetical protein
MFEKIKSFFLATFLKQYILPDDRPPVRRPKHPKYIDPPVFRDKYAERLNDPEFREFNDKVMQAVSNIKAGLDPED